MECVLHFLVSVLLMCNQGMNEVMPGTSIYHRTWCELEEHVIDHKLLYRIIICGLMLFKGGGKAPRY